MLRTFVGLSCLFVLGCSRGEIAIPRFEPGQVWQYRTRPDEEASRLVILKVEADEKRGPAVLVQVKDLQLKHPKSPGGVKRVIPLLAISDKALAASVTTLETAGSVPNGWEEDYKYWKPAFDAGNVGAAIVPVAEAIAMMEKLYAK